MDRIPATLQDIDIDWLAAVFRKRGYDATLLDAELVSANSGTTGRAFFRLQWSDSEVKDAPGAIFVKLPPTDLVQLESNAEMGMGVREAQFYGELSHDIPILIPKPFYSDWESDKSAYIMILEDLSAAGGRPLVLGPDSEYWVAEQLIPSLARLHRTFWNSPRFDGDLSWLAPYAPIRSPEVPTMIERCFRLFGDFMPPIFRDATNLFLSKQHELADLFSQGTPTVVHGDCHLSNLFVDSGNKLGFYDWAIVSKMPAMWDVAYGLCISFPPDIRRKAEEKLLPVYVDLLNQDNTLNINLEDTRLQYRKMAFFSWIAAVSTLGCGERMQPLEWGITAMRWTTQAIEELEVLDLLRDELRS